jgi:peptidoglycan/xylan/chitin deacetylase (PgdA/CDA1 family)
MSLGLSRQHLAATALVESGFSRWTRQRLRGQLAVLTFHGLRREQEVEWLDLSLHETVEAFRRVCGHLAAHYEVVSAEEAVVLAETEGRSAGRRPRVVLTFDDGYASNLRLAWPILREFDLPATVFVTTSFVDGELLWFQKLDLALARARGERLTLAIGERFFDWPLGSREERETALSQLLGALKQLPWAALQAKVEKIIGLLGVDVGKGWPEPLRPLSWEELRELAADGRIEIGGHTDRHPILGRCTDEEARAEILTGARKLRAGLGRPVRWFAYPNGGPGDFDAAKSAGWLKEAGFEGAFSMTNARVQTGMSRWALPRYGAPRTVREAEATASGAFETVKQWRRHFKRQAAL